MSGPASSGRVTCPRCGTDNSADDQFCGNCGADLTTAAVAAPADPAAAPETALVRCPSCGTANPASRSFCQKCGSKLAGAAPVGAPRPLPDAAQMAPTTPPAPTVAAPPTAARRADPVDEGGGGFSSWLVLAGAGIIAGAIIVVVVVMLGSGQPPPPTGASPVPSASVTPSEAPVPSGSVAPSVSRGTTNPLTFVDRVATFADGAAVNRSYGGLGVVTPMSRLDSKVWP
jgi:hypothetical protein